MAHMNKTRANAQCPFCGSDDLDYTHDVVFIRIQCQACGAMGPACSESCGEANTAWDQRHDKGATGGNY